MTREENSQGGTCWGSTLALDKVKVSQSGKYICQAVAQDGTIVAEKVLTLLVKSNGGLAH